MGRHRKNTQTPQPSATRETEATNANFESSSLQGESKGENGHSNNGRLQGEEKMQSGNEKVIATAAAAPAKFGTVEKARNVFLPTACQLCKCVAAPAPEDTPPVPSGSSEGLTAKNVESGLLFLCGGCRMVKYCCKQHQVSDWASHKPLCKITRQYLQVHRKQYLYEDVSEKHLSETEWLQARYHFIEIFRDYLGRELHAFEKEILLFPNVCAICRKATPSRRPQNAEATPSDLKTCPKCNGITFCSKHFRKDHDHCRELRLWTEVLRWEHEHGLIMPDLSNELRATLINLSDFPSSIQEYHSRCCSDQAFEAYAHEHANATTTTTKSIKCEIGHDDIPFIRRTDVLTVPFSIAWILRQLLHRQSQQPAASRMWNVDAITSLTVHLIGAEREFEGCCPTKWEAFSHLFPKLKQLQLVLVGPELGEFGADNLSLCAACVQEGRQIRIQFETALYHEYCRTPKFVEPNIVCAFNCGLYRTTGFVNPAEDSWKPTLQQLMSSRSTLSSEALLPAFVVVTEYTQAEILQDSLRIQKDCPRLHEITELCGRNPFRSLRPQRALINEDTEPLMFKNNFITLFVTEGE